jgi:hypothetical protein
MNPRARPNDQHTFTTMKIRSANIIKAEDI